MHAEQACWINMAGRDERHAPSRRGNGSRGRRPRRPARRRHGRGVARGPSGPEDRVVVKFMLGDLGAAKVRAASRAGGAAAQVSPHVDAQMLDHGVSEDGVPFIVAGHLGGTTSGTDLEEQGDGPGEGGRHHHAGRRPSPKVHAAGLLLRPSKPDNIFLVDGGEGGVREAPRLQHRQGAVHGGEPRRSTARREPAGSSAPVLHVARAGHGAEDRSIFAATSGPRRRRLRGPDRAPPFDSPSFGALAVKIATGNPPKPTGSRIPRGYPPSTSGSPGPARRTPPIASGSRRRARRRAPRRVRRHRLDAEPADETATPARAASPQARAPRAPTSRSPRPRSIRPAPTKGPLARSEAGVSVPPPRTVSDPRCSSSVASSSSPSSSSASRSRAARPPATTNSARPEPTAPVTVTVTVSCPRRRSRSVPSGVRRGRCGAKPPGASDPAVRPPAPTPRARAVARREAGARAKAGAKPAPPSSGPTYTDRAHAGRGHCSIRCGDARREPGVRGRASQTARSRLEEGRAEAARPTAGDLASARNALREGLALREGAAPTARSPGCQSAWFRPDAITGFELGKTHLLSATCSRRTSCSRRSDASRIDGGPPARRRATSRRG